MTIHETLREFAVFRGNIWILVVFVLVALDLVLKNRMYLTLIAVAAFFAAFLARLFLPFVGQVIVFLGVGLFLLWKGRMPIQQWRRKTLTQTRQAMDYARSLDAAVVEPIRTSTLPGRVLVNGVVVPARSRTPIAEGAAVTITSAGPNEVWVIRKP